MYFHYHPPFQQLLSNICDDLTIVEVRGFLFAITTQQPISTTCFSTETVPELAVQSTKAKPTTKNSDIKLFK